MAEITAAMVKTLRDSTGLPMMDCKKALVDADGDPEAAKEGLRKKGKRMEEKQAGRATTAGRIAVYADAASGTGGIVELRCETAPVASNEEFVRLAGDLAKQLAVGPGAKTPEELLGQSSPGKPGMTLQEQYGELYNRMRENFQFERIERIEGTCAGYAHHNGASGAILQVEGGDVELARDICMHIVAMRPTAIASDELDPAVVETERQLLTEQAKAEGEGKPEKIIEKMVQGRLQKEVFAKHCLAEQVFVKAEDGKSSVGKVAKDAGMKLVRFVHWELAKE